MLWLIYALGGGWGHLTRAAALARAAPGPVRILTNSPYAGQVPGLDIAVVDSREAAVAQIEASKPAALIVDTFPRGIGGELAAILPTLQAAKILVHRDINPAYATPLRDFVASQYDLVLLPGEGSEFPGQVTDPWIIRPSAAVPHDVVVCASGNAEELEWYGVVTSRLTGSHCIAPVCPPGCPPERWIRHWPAIDFFPSARVMVGGAGYNAVYESLACAVPLVARPWPRKYDRQSLRAQRHSLTTVTTPDEAVSAAHHYLSRDPNPRPVSFPNGAPRAVALIQSVLRPCPEPRA